MTWFEDFTGVSEVSPERVREVLGVDGERLTSTANGRSWGCGDLQVDSLAELRTRLEGERNREKSSITEVVADVQRLHADAANAGATFQVASQFNLLEMISPGVTPERGVGIYEQDATQGPACAIACGAGTIYRNYFVPLPGGVGQTADRQIDCSADLEAALRGDGPRLWETRNGYALPSGGALDKVTNVIDAAGPEERRRLQGTLRVGIHRNTQVTLPGCDHAVTQVYCSAMPVAYSDSGASAWEALGRLTLEAAYEATLIAAALYGGDRPVFLTLLGGGAFGNPAHWIEDAAVAAVEKVGGLDVRIVSYGRPSTSAAAIINRTMNG